MSRVYYGTIVNPVNADIVDILIDALLAVDANGVIAWLEPNVPPSSLQDKLAHHGWLDQDLIELTRWEWLMPGFIDTHTHASQFPNIGLGQQYQLLDWLSNVTFPRETSFADLEYARKTYREVIRRSLAYGTTTSCYYATLHLEATKVLADLAGSLGQRAFIGKCNMNANCPPEYIEASTEKSLEDTIAIIKYCESLDTDIVYPIITPRFAISCSSDLLKSLGNLAQETGTAIQTHISENRGEIEFTKELFPDCESYTHVYDSHGLLRHNTILAHAVHLTEEEMDLVKARNAGISHCPTSNFNLNSGCAKVGRLMDKGIKVGLGTDCSGGYAASMLAAIQHAAIAAKVTSFTDTSEYAEGKYTKQPLSLPSLVHLATLGGAAVCNLDSKIGSFDVGKDFDALLISVDLSRGNPGLFLSDDKGIDGVESAWTLIEKFLFCGDDRNISKVWVKGRLVSPVVN